ncbi:PREDICTED: uncharacterized protein LOC107333364 isoform X2 [Acropora digitifera]|uniref:uncharacterized protein LOC107333364 isoform X2 n=1 Tax=Acropora digitifera TaxID=70779 RepID=UPI00077AEE39|nr:PREDICTED: uncharacterized protein LOC107333364 isoform X2 [Acropora digitifera]
MMMMIAMVTGQVGSATGRVGSATGRVGSATGRVVTLKGHRIAERTQGRMIMTVWTKMQMKKAKWTMTRRRKKISMMNYCNSKWKMTRKLCLPRELLDLERDAAEKTNNGFRWCQEHLLQSVSFSCVSRLHTCVSKDVSFRDENRRIPVSDGNIS